MRITIADIMVTTPCPLQIAAIDSAIALERSCQTADKGHRHSSGKTVLHIWFYHNRPFGRPATAPNSGDDGNDDESNNHSDHHNSDHNDATDAFYIGTPQTSTPAGSPGQHSADGAAGGYQHTALAVISPLPDFGFHFDGGTNAKGVSSHWQCEPNGTSWLDVFIMEAESQLNGNAASNSDAVRIASRDSVAFDVCDSEVSGAIAVEPVANVTSAIVCDSDLEEHDSCAVQLAVECDDEQIDVQSEIIQTNIFEQSMPLDEFIMFFERLDAFDSGLADIVFRVTNILDCLRLFANYVDTRCPMELEPIEDILSDRWWMYRSDQHDVEHG